MYVEAARAVGSSHPWVIWRHIIPNVMAPYLIMLTAQFDNAILVEAKDLTYHGRLRLVHAADHVGAAALGVADDDRS